MLETFTFLASLMWFLLFLLKIRKSDLLHPFVFYSFLFILYYPVGILLHYVGYWIGVKKLWFSNMCEVVYYMPYILLYSVLFYSLFLLFFLSLNSFKFTFLNKSFYGSSYIYRYRVVEKYLVILITIIAILVSIFYVKSIGGIYILKGDYSATFEEKVGKGILRGLTYSLIYYSGSWIVLWIRLKYNRFFAYILCSSIIIALVLVFGERKSAITIMIPLLLLDVLEKRIKFLDILLMLGIAILLIFWGIIRNSFDLIVFLNYNNLKDYIIIFLKGYLGSYSHLEPLAGILHLDLHTDFQFLKLLHDYFIYNIPRYIYPSKPLMLGAQSIITPRFPIPEEHLSAVPTSVGEALLSAGVIGIFIYAFLHALFIYAISTAYYRKIFLNKDCLIFYGYLLYVVQGVHRSGMFGVVTSLFQLIVLYSLIYFKLMSFDVFKSLFSTKERRN